MSHLHFVLRPTLWLHDDGGSFLEEIDISSLPTLQSQKVDREILQGRTPIHDIFYNYGQNITAKYDPQRRLMHVWVWKPNFERTDSQELSDFLHDASPEGYGPDGWMEGELGILDEDDFDQLSFPSPTGAELVPRIIEVYEVTTGGQETQIDLSRLPAHQS